MAARGRKKLPVKRRQKVEEIDNITPTRENAVRQIAEDATDEKARRNFGNPVGKGIFPPEQADGCHRDESDKSKNPVGMLRAVHDTEGHSSIVDPDDVKEAGNDFDDAGGDGLVNRVGEIRDDEPLRPLIEDQERQAKAEEVLLHEETGERASITSSQRSQSPLADWSDTERRQRGHSS